VAELPSTVFKMEQESLTKEFEGYTLSTSDTIIVSNEDLNMSTAVLKSAPASDLDGLFDEAPAADAALAKADAEADAAAADVAADSVAADAIQMFSGEEQLSKEAFDALADDAEVIVKQEGEDDKTFTKDQIVKGDEGAPKTGGSPGNPVVDNTSDTGAVQLDEGGVPAGFRKEERVLKEFVDGKIVEKFAAFLINEESGEEIFAGFIEKMSDDAPAAKVDATEYTPAEVKLFEAMGVMAKAVKDIGAKIEKQDARIEAVSKTAVEAVEVAENTVVMTAADDLDNSLATLRGTQAVLKGAAPAATEVTDIFKGLLPGIEGNAA
jgi:hypothetical protein